MNELLISHLSQPVNGASSNPITRINLQHSPKVFSTKFVLFHTLVQESTLYQDRYIGFIIFKNLHNKCWSEHSPLSLYGDQENDMVQIIRYVVELMDRPSHNPNLFKLQLQNCIHTPTKIYIGTAIIDKSAFRW